ncbi:ATP-dependent DNA helicase-like protein [Lipomyces oligophaga]|uniref:ATP-dependent DNA helicase-like protein n=1 Tax=Lipomyces oligophaga TaxID=45792 RepID=UPI0034CF226F
MTVNEDGQKMYDLGFGDCVSESVLDAMFDEDIDLDEDFLQSTPAPPIKQAVSRLHSSPPLSKQKLSSGLATIVNSTSPRNGANLIMEKQQSPRAAAKLSKDNLTSVTAHSIQPAGRSLSNLFMPSSSLPKTSQSPMNTREVVELPYPDHLEDDSASLLSWSSSLPLSQHLCEPTIDRSCQSNSPHIFQTRPVVNLQEKNSSDRQLKRQYSTTTDIVPLEQKKNRKMPPTGFLDDSKRPKRERTTSGSKTFENLVGIDVPSRKPLPSSKREGHAERKPTKPPSKTPSKPIRKVNLLELSGEQKAVIKMVCQDKKSLFFTGSAGTGKSVLLRKIIENLRLAMGEGVAVTASTGLAACNIGGTTLHSFAGIGLGRENVESLLKRVRRNRIAQNRWKKTKVLIIDEISMVDGALFDKLNIIAQKIRKVDKPFGGIQLVLTGDFFQLPPVGNESVFTFEAQTWNSAVPITIGLTRVFRQKDPVFASFLNKMRIGQLTKRDEEIFLARKTVVFNDGLEATELFPTRFEVERSNNRRMSLLDGPEFEYYSQDGGDEKVREGILASCIAPGLIKLKKGAQVMMIKNMDTQLVNGSLGQVMDFMTSSEFGMMQIEAFTDNYMGDSDEDDFANGIEGMKLQFGGRGESTADDMLEVAELKMRQNMRKELIEKANAESSKTKYPLVRFTFMDGTFREVLVLPESWKTELPNGTIQASRTQIPLIPAWALSIHKAQGQTLDRVKVDLSRVFEKGQAYVALSRATSREGLEVKNFSISKVKVHDKVRRFYESLDTIGKSGGSQHPEEEVLRQMEGGL